jgi:hypothetical protein
VHNLRGELPLSGHYETKDQGRSIQSRCNCSICAELSLLTHYAMGSSSKSHVCLQISGAYDTASQPDVSRSYSPTIPFLEITLDIPDDLIWIFPKTHSWFVHTKVAIVQRFLLIPNSTTSRILEQAFHYLLRHELVHVSVYPRDRNMECLFQMEESPEVFPCV